MTSHKWKYPKHRFSKIPVPASLQWSDWKKWRKDMKSKYPIRYFFQETLPQYFHGKVYNIRHGYYWPFIHRFHPKYRYHIIKTDLKPGYYDPDTRIAHAIFSVFSEFMKYNIENKVVNWEGDDLHANFWTEANEIYDWLKNVRQFREEKFEKEHPFPKIPENIDIFEIHDKKHRDKPFAKEVEKYSQLETEEKNKWEQDDEEMMIRIIQIRKFLWYA